jgi:hypothetical protein
MADSTVLNPVDIETAILAAVEEVAEGIKVTSARHSAYLEADHLYDLAWSRAYLAAVGTIAEREAHCHLATEEERRARDVAEAAHKYADRRTKAAEARLSAYQTLSKSVTAMYSAAGHSGY